MAAVMARVERFPAAPMSAANSARSRGTPATPTPPIRCPPLYIEMPPPLTAASLPLVLSSRSCLPVVMPSDGRYFVSGSTDQVVRAWAAREDPDEDRHADQHHRSTL